MTVIAHVGGVPVEELIPIAVSAGSVLLLAHASLSLLLRRHRGAGHRDHRSLEPCDRARLTRARQI